jgi:F-type H+-transporting ATPase subunit a
VSETTPAVESAVHVAGPAPAEHAPAYDFMATLMHHIRPYPAVEYIHGHPVLILDLGRYAARNLEHLSHNESFAKADGSAYSAWAAEVTASGDYKGLDSASVAKAMTVAHDEAYLGTLPKSLSWLNQQTFFGSFALIAMAFILLVFARRKPDQLKPANRVQHLIEATVLFIRDDIVRPNIQHHADAWVPHFTAIFLAILAFNLVGLAPIFSAASGNPGVTAAFALTTFIAMLVYGIKEQGFAHFWINLVPVQWSSKPMDMVIWLMLAPIELIGLFIKPAALAIRLFANMFAGHAVLISFSSLGFVLLASNPDNGMLALGMGGFGWVLTIALYFLELLVALLQAYVFTILSAVFIGQSMHPEH